MKRRDRNNQQQTCYMCDLPATSKEHVPPKCFFPEQKDLGAETNYRVKLLSVPSCSQHNLSKAQDDEYVLFVITSHYENHPVAQQHFSTKIMRAVRRRPSLLKFSANKSPAVVDGRSSFAYEVDRDRFDNVFDHMARALFFHHYNSKLSLPIAICTPDLFMIKSSKAKKINDMMEEIEIETIKELSNQLSHGTNPDIFSYQFRYRDEIPSFLVRMTFYGGFVVIAYASPSIPVHPEAS
jgi:hypothetical protein